jgi:DNA-binding HxlR family transcriptional regulator
MKSTFSNWPCSVARVMDVFGDAWTPLIMRDAVQGVTRFDDFQKSLGVARNTLSDRLNKLVDSGVLVKRLYQDNPPRNEYLLTDMGRDFFPVLVAIRNFGDRWLDGGQGAPVTLHHLSCGHDLGSRSICSSCGEDVVLGDIEFRVGPGYPESFEPGRDLRPRLAPASKLSHAPLKRSAAPRKAAAPTRRSRSRAAS